MSFKVGCKSEPSETWAYNALRFPTQEMAEAYGHDLSDRWTSLREWEVHESDDPVHYYNANRELVEE